MNFSVSPDLEAALGGSVSDTEASEKRDLAPAASTNSADILMHVEMPVTIVLGRTKMRLKDLLKLTNGSVVELDQMLDDEVEVRVNNCVIAYGEVVAVDGNYAVRILRMAAPRNIPNLRGALPGKAA
jgi:flagellar motor switch protein FliN